jgi:hypothetical protein
MKKILLVGAAALALSACADTAAQQAQTKAAFQAAVAQCRAPYPHQQGNFVARAHCLVDTDAQFYPNDPLAPVLGPTMLSLAAKADRGEISPEEYEAQFAQIRFSAQQELARTNAAVASARASAVLGAAAMLNATRPPPAPPPVVFPVAPVMQNRSLSCTSNGIGQFVYTNCN